MFWWKVQRSHNSISNVACGCHTSFVQDSVPLECHTLSLGECSVLRSSAGFKQSRCLTHEEAHTTVLRNSEEPLTL